MLIFWSTFSLEGRQKSCVNTSCAQSLSVVCHISNLYGYFYEPHSIKFSQGNHNHLQAVFFSHLSRGNSVPDSLYQIPLFASAGPSTLVKR